jgi:hypothetical protein
VEVRVVWIKVTIDSTSLREERRAVTSLAVRGVTMPVTTGIIVRIVAFRLVAMLSREIWMVGAMEAVTSDPMTEAEQLLFHAQWWMRFEDLLIEVRSEETELLRTETEPVIVVMAEVRFLKIELSVVGTSLERPTTVPSTVESVEATSGDTGAAMAWDPRVRAAIAMMRNCILDEIL